MAQTRSEAAAVSTLISAGPLGAFSTAASRPVPALYHDVSRSLKSNPDMTFGAAVLLDVQDAVGSVFGSQMQD